MKYTKLGTSDLTVSRICMGCMGLGKRRHLRRQSDHVFKPVLFEFPTYEYFVMGDQIGDCAKMNR